ncbi:MAG: class C beta-lactamase-related serine hydrolase [Chloroflexi bacterium]|nr:MAG: class C beta-lactamase-related serine hydrolase [Chloroflexota bacterium]
MSAKRFPRSRPEAQGIPSAAIQNFVDAANATIHDLHSLMIVRHGAVVAEGWWAPCEEERNHVLFSLSKSFTSSAIGLAVAEGLLTVADPVISFFPDDLPETVSDNLAAMTVYHLLAMCTGHSEDTTKHLHAAADGNWARAFLAQPVTHKPGTHFLYNTGATYMLSAIIQKVTGETLLDYLTPRLFAPLGIANPTWESCPRGINTGGYGLNVTTEDIACFGQMYLQKGVWQGRRILSADWVAEATGYQSDNSAEPNPDWAQGYGYQFWRSRHNGYRGDGAFGQFCLVLPEQDAVIAITAGVGNMQSVLDLVWEYLLPALGSQPLAEDRSAQARLSETLAALAIPPQSGKATSPIAAQVAGRRYQLEANEEQIQTFCFDFGENESICTIGTERGEEKIVCGQGQWRKGEAHFADRGPQPAAVSGGWIDPAAYALRVYYYESPFSITYTCCFDGDSLTVDSALNVSFGPTQMPRLVGQVAR